MRRVAQTAGRFPGVAAVTVLTAIGGAYAAMWCRLTVAGEPIELARLTAERRRGAGWWHCAPLRPFAPGATNGEGEPMKGQDRVG
jgi:hypothetical protein